MRVLLFFLWHHSGLSYNGEILQRFAVNVSIEPCTYHGQNKKVSATEGNGPPSPQGEPLSPLGCCVGLRF